MPDLVCIWCGKIDCTSEYSLKGHLAVCSKRFSAYDVNEQVNESDKQIPRFASLKNDGDYDDPGTMYCDPGTMYCKVLTH